MKAIPLSLSSRPVRLLRAAFTFCQARLHRLDRKEVFRARFAERIHSTWVHAFWWVTAGTVLGGFAWGTTEAPLVAILAPVLAATAARRWFAFAFWMTYHFAMLKWLFAFLAEPVGRPLPAIGMWLGLSLLCALPWTLMWSRSPHPGRVATMASLGFLVALLPPIALVAPGHPVVAWGYLLQGWGWAGIGFAALTTGYAAASLRIYHHKVVAFGGLALLAVLLHLKSMTVDHLPMRSAGMLHGVSTKFGRLPKTNDELALRIASVGSVIQKLAKNPDLKDTVLVFPEATLGFWQGSNDLQLRSEILMPAHSAGISLILGLELRGENDMRENVVNLYLADGSVQSIAQHPSAFRWLDEEWKIRSFKLELGRSSTLRINRDVEVRVLVGHEELLPFMYLLSEVQGRHAATVVLNSNLEIGSTWASHAWRQHSDGMARLFGRRIVRAENVCRARASASPEAGC